MNEWKKYRIGDLVELNIIDKPLDGNHGEIHPKASDFVDNGIPFVMATDISGGNVNLTNCKFISFELSKTLRKGFAKEGDVLLTHKASIGRTAIVPKLDIEYIVLTPQVTYYRIIDKNKLNNRFLKYYFDSKEFQDTLNTWCGSGSTRAYIGITEQLNLPVRIPSLPTQTAIASILSSLDDKIELNNAISKNLEDLAQILFKNWFVDFEFPNENGKPYKSSGGEMVDSELGKIPKGWKVGTLSDIIDFSNGYAFNSMELLSSDTGDCYHVFKMGHIKKGGGFNANGTKSYFERRKAEKLEKFVLRTGDLLMCMTDMKGIVALLGHTALMNEDDKYIVNQRVGLLRPRNDLGISYPFLYILTNSNDFIEDLRSRANSGVQVNLSTAEIKNSKIVLPPIDINITFNNAVTPIFDSLFNSSKEKDELSKLRKTLLPKLISGELEVNETLSQTEKAI